MTRFGPRHLEVYGMGIGVTCAFALAAGYVVYGWWLGYFGAVCAVIGLSLLVSRIWAFYTWVEVAARVTAVAGDAPPTLTLRYAFGGDTYTKDVSESSNKAVGDRFWLLVNPHALQQSLTHAYASWVLGCAFVVFGLFWMLNFPTQM